MIVVDTGVLLAIADADDRWHPASTALLANYPSSQLILPDPVIPETGGMIAAVRYADMDLGTVDAAVIAIAERLNIVTLATINPRDFPVVKPAHCDAFELVPTL
jgi:predicted nucleic acid-binding protein